LQFSKHFQNQRVSVQAFPKIPLAVLWDFKGLQASKTTSDVPPNFLQFPPPFSRIPAAAAPHSLPAPHGSEAGQLFAGIDGAAG
jgi:hypothetical protein